MVVRRLSGLLLGVALTVAAPPAGLADARVDSMAKELKSASDWRVRVQAATGLGASGDASALKALCDGLSSDANTAVRSAAAAALGKLGKTDAIKCLQTAEGKEGEASVKKQITKAVDELKLIQLATNPPAPTAESKFYVSVDITNKTKRTKDELDPIVRTALVAKLLAKKGYAVAPKGETVQQGTTIVNGKKLKGFQLVATVEAPTYAGGNLTQIVRVTILTYPGKALQGEVAPKFTQSDTPKEDKQSENALLKLCAESAAESFLKIASSL